MIQIIPPQDEPTYEELRNKCIWLRGGAREGRRNLRYALWMIVALTVMLAVTVTLLVLTWAWYIPIGRW